MPVSVEISKKEEIEKLLAAIKSQDTELIIGKFSPYCPVSYSAEKVFDKWISAVKEDLLFTKINVVTERELSRYIAEILDIRHESPQVIWINSDGNVKWHGSHYAIDSISLDKNLSASV